MEFFILLLAVLQLFVVPAGKSTGGELIGSVGFRLMPVYWAYAIAASLYAVIYILKGIGLYTMARKAGLNQLWSMLAFIPFGNTFLIGKLSIDNTSKVKPAINAKLIIIAAFVLEILYTVSMAINAITWSIVMKTGGFEIRGDSFAIINYTFDRMIAVTNILNTWALSFLAGFAGVALYAMFFRRYSPSNMLLIILLNIFIPVAWIFIFIRRNAKPLTIEEYYKQMNVSTTFNPNGTDYQNSNPRPPIDPFNEYSNNSTNNTDPFGYTNSSKPTDPFGYDEKPKSSDPFDDDINTKK